MDNLRTYIKSLKITNFQCPGLISIVGVRPSVTISKQIQPRRAEKEDEVEKEEEKDEGERKEEKIKKNKTNVQKER